MGVAVYSGKHKDYACGHSFFKSDACEFTNIIIVCKKANKCMLYNNNFTMNRDHSNTWRYLVDNLY